MIKKILSTAFLVVGLILIFQGLFDISKRLGLYKISTSIQTIETKDSKTNSSTLPINISIPSLSLQLPIEPVLLKDSTWPTSQTGVSFLENSGKVGSTGNLIFYGHNWRNLLGNLHKVKVGENIVLHGQNGQNFQYSISYIATVEANDISILADTSDERITLYTCTGFLDQKRLVVVAKRV